MTASTLGGMDRIEGSPVRGSPVDGRPVDGSYVHRSLRDDNSTDGNGDRRCRAT